VWLAREVWPIIRAQRPDARLEIVGAQPARAVRALEDPRQGILVTGSVPDVRPYLWRAAVSVAPLHTARGVQNKVLEAAAAGLPVVVTPEVAAGLPPEVATACATAEDAQQFAAHVVGWLRIGPDARRLVAARANLAGLTWKARLKPVRAMVEKAVFG
jgi:glycosyltransferase involved in cell wall biosynthesis